jgi:hypothetical protein
MSNEQFATEMTATLKQFNRGVNKVELVGNMMTVTVSSNRTAFNVQLDLLRTRSFSSVVITNGRCVQVHAVIA